MSNIVTPTNAVAGFNNPVDIDDILYFEKDRYIDLNDKSLNRYLITFTLPGNYQVTWKYLNYESRDLDYSFVVSGGTAPPYILPPETKSADFTPAVNVDLYLVDTSANDVNISFDTNLAYDPGWSWDFKKTSPNYSIIFTALNGETIDDELSKTSRSYNTGVEIRFDGVNFKIT